MTYKKKKVGNQPYYAEFIKGDQKQPGSKTAPKRNGNKPRKVKASPRDDNFRPTKSTMYGKPETFRPKPNTDRRDDRSSGGFGNRDGEKKPWDGKPSFSARSFDKPAYKKRDNDRPSYGDKPAFKKRDNDSRPSYGNRDGERKPFERREWSDKPPRRDDSRPSYGDKPAFKKRDDDSRPSYGNRDGERKPFERREWSDKPPRRDDSRPSYGDKPAFKKRDDDSRPSYGNRDGERKPFERREWSDKPPRRDDSRPSYGNRDGERKPFERREWSDKPPRRDDDSRPAYGNRDENRSFERDEPKAKTARNHKFGEKRLVKPESENDEEVVRTTPRTRIVHEERSERSEESKSSFKSSEERRSGKFRTAPNYNLEKATERYDRAPRRESRTEDDLMRLNRYIANAGVCSRRDADTLIESGQISVNGKTVNELGYKVKQTDVVKYGNRVLNPEKIVYLLLNKPKGYITTTEDPDERDTVMDLIGGACKERIYPVGRLDRNTTGLLLFTNDGELAEKLMHPSNEIQKIYQVELDKPITTEHFEAIKEGIELEDGPIKPDDLAIVTPDAEVVGIEIHSGRNRIVRRIFENFGYDVQKLDRTVYAGLNKKELPRGNWRFLTEREVIKLKYLI